MRRWRTILGGLLLLAVAAGGLAAWRSDRFLFEIPAWRTQRCFDKIGHALAKHQGLCFLMTFDEARPVEWIGRGMVQYPGTERVAGRLGFARRFNGKASTLLETSAVWPALGSNYTLSLWVKVEATGMDQEIWYTFIQERRTGFRLCNGQMTFFVPGGEARPPAAYPFEAYGRFVHLAGVVDAAHGEARLYENGALKATIPVGEVVHPSQNLEFSKTRLYAVTAPFCGDLDEAAAWTRCLPAAEIKRLARARRSLPFLLEPLPCWRWKLFRAIRDAIPATLKTLDRFNPWLHEGRVEAADLPEIQFHFSARDARHYIHAHDDSLASGRRTADAANPRKIYAEYNHRTVEAQLWLDGSDTAYPAEKRPGYILEVPPEAPAFGARLLRLVPPEHLAGDLNLLGRAFARTADGGAPAPGLCRLAIDGQSKGIYVFEPYEERGLNPGERTWVANGAKTQVDWLSLFRGAAQNAGENPPPDAETGTRLIQARRLLANDIFNPWSAREWDWRIRQWQAVAAAAGPQVLTPYAILGSNSAPYYITGDLNLAAGAAHGLTWSSSRPNVIDPCGKVARPAGDLPVGVTLTATGPAGNCELNFRVMPLQPRLPALMLYIDEPLAGTHRADFSARFIPAGDAPAWLLRGGQATGGGIKHHGNTSYWRGAKKPFSLRFDAPHHLVGRSASCHLYLLNGYVDATKLKNKFAYDLFRAGGAPDRPRYAPEIDWTEVFVNGAYFGIYEMCTRVDETLLGFREDPANPAAGGVIYKIRPSNFLFVRPDPDSFEQVFPAPGKARCEQPLQDLVAFTGPADPATFADGIADRIDLDNAIDFLILLNFAQNVDGRTTNFFLARGPESGARFFFVPWDYDHTFEKSGLWLTNHLFERLYRECPDFPARLARRWTELRQGLFADAALEARLAEMAVPLAGYMDWEDAQYPRAGLLSYPERLEQFRQAALAEARTLDERFETAPATAEASGTRP